MPITKDYDLYRGDTFGPHSVKFIKAGFDFTGCIVRIEGIGSNKYVFTLTPDVDTTTEGEISFDFTLPIETTSLIIGNVEYDIQLEYPGGETKTPVKGTLNYQKDITRNV